MANSKYEYVRFFEQDSTLLPNTWIVVRVDGRGFHKLSNHYCFTKPNDRNALDLMNRAAQHVLHILPDIIIAYGVSDEYSFVFHKSSVLFERRREKIVSTVVSTFTAAYVFHWNEVMNCAVGDVRSADASDRQPLNASFLPTFDGRAVCYPSIANLRDYLCWRQVDCHINNLYNTTFWALVQKGGMSNTEAEEFLKGTVAADKNEILWSRFGINYNNEEEMYRKGSVVFREYALEAAKTPVNVGDEDMSDVNAKNEQLSRTQADKMKKMRQKAQIVVRHVDIIKDEFWNQRPWILSGVPGMLANNDKHA